MAELLPELITEILLWLPVKSLKRCRCLSKSICSFIDSPDFINSHLITSSLNFNHHKLIFTDLKCDQFIVFDLNLDHLDLEPEILTQTNLGEQTCSTSKGLVQYNSVYVEAFGFRIWDSSDQEEEEIVIPEEQSRFSKDEIFGCCNGLLLLNRKEFSFALWNPSTGDYIDLPDCPFEVTEDIEIYRFFWWGLGFDSSSDDYKVFLMIRVKREDVENELQVWIFGLKSNVWRRAPNFPYTEGMILRRRLDFGHFTDGCLYWLCHNWQSDIVTFDVVKETFALMPQPDCPIKSMEGLHTQLHLLEGCLCMSYYSSSTPCQADLYIRKNDGNGKFRWTQLYSVKEPLSFDISWFKYYNVLGYSKRGDKILLDFGSRMPCMVLYDLKQKNFGKIDMYKGHQWEFPILCLESLVSVSGGDLS